MTAKQRRRAAKKERRSLQQHGRFKVYAEPFRLGTKTYSWGVIFRFRGLWRSFGRS